MILNVMFDLNSDNLNKNYYDFDYNDTYSELVDVPYNVELLGLLNNHLYYDRHDVYNKPYLIKFVH
jgi:hypothetical protein